MSNQLIQIILVAIGLLILTSVIGSQKQSSNTNSNYYSVQERRMPCGRIIRREVIHLNDAWKKTVTLLDPSGNVIATKTKTIEPEQCARIQAGQFVEGLWEDCKI